MRLGLGLPLGGRGEALAADARAVERAGFDSVWFFDTINRGNMGLDPLMAFLDPVLVGDCLQLDEIAKILYFVQVDANVLPQPHLPSLLYLDPRAQDRAQHEPQRLWVGGKCDLVIAPFRLGDILSAVEYEVAVVGTDEPQLEAAFLDVEISISLIEQSRGAGSQGSQILFCALAVVAPRFDFDIDHSFRLSGKCAPGI